MHHHIKVGEHRATGARRRARRGLVALTGAGAAVLGSAGAAQATPVPTGTVDPGGSTLYPDPWDRCVVAYGDEILPIDDCPPDIGGIEIDCNGFVCVIWPESATQEGSEDPEDLLCPPGMPDVGLEGDPNQPCGGGMPPWEDPGPPQP